MVIRTGVKAFDDACLLAEGARQTAVTAAIAAGGSFATVQGALKTADIAFYRSAVASAAITNSVQTGSLVEALKELGTGGV